MASLDIDERTAAELNAAATAKGVSVEKPMDAGVSTGKDRRQSITAEEFLSEVESLSFDGPTLPADFSRADIYYEYDECAV